jgi:hypothetical protein
MSMKHSNNTIGNRTRNLPACSTGHRVPLRRVCTRSMPDFLMNWSVIPRQWVSDLMSSGQFIIFSFNCVIRRRCQLLKLYSVGYTWISEWYWQEKPKYQRKAFPSATLPICHVTWGGRVVLNCRVKSVMYNFKVGLFFRNTSRGAEKTKERCQVKYMVSCRPSQAVELCNL